ncbi:MAG TPA: hypothetical protein VFK89_05790 [Actinomycetota bacterium]|nr:hypothetical protein [Actinomycetota bacterium]
MTEISEDVKAKSAALIRRLDSDAEFAQRFTEDSLGTVKAEGIPDDALPYLAGELDKHFADADMEGHRWVTRGGRRVWVWTDWTSGF